MRTLLLASALSLAALPALAWDPSPIAQGPGTNAASSPAADSGSAAGAAAAASARVNAHTSSHASVGNVSGGGGGAGGAGGAGGTGGKAQSNVTVNNSDGNGVGARSPDSRPVASAVAPAAFSSNPCGGSPTTGGLQTGPVGLSFGVGGGFDKVCQIAMYLRDPLAKAWACRHMDGIREAARDIGQPCSEDEPKVQQVSEVMPIPPIPPIRSMPDGVPAWCGTTNGRDPAADRVACLRALNANIAHLRETH